MFLVGPRQYRARRKRLEFQLVLWVSSSLHTLSDRDHFLLNDFIKGDFFGSLPIGQVSLKRFSLPSKKIYLSLTTGRDFVQALYNKKH